MKRTILIRFFLVAFLVILPQVAQSQTLPSQAFDDYVNHAMKEWEVPGVAIAVIKDDRVIFARGYGVRELGKPGAVDENTLFAIGSSSKAFTAAALAMLVDEGKLKWEDPATKYLPGFQVFDPYTTRELTVSDLVTHRSGLSRGDMLWYASPYDRPEVLRRVRYLKPTWSLRARFGYQNIMFLAAGEIIPSITKKTWDDFLQERIFTPLGMKSTSTSIKSFVNAPDVATPHSMIDDKVQPIAWRNIDNIGPAGSINSNVVDMAQWIRLQLGAGTYQNQKLLSAAAVKEMQSSQTVIRIEGNNLRLYPEAHFLNYGMGWFLSDYRGRKLVEHGGAIDGMRAEVAMIPEEKLGVVILTNLNGTIFPHALMYKVFDSYLGDRNKDWCSDMLKVTKGLEQQAKAAEKKAESERVQGTSPSLALEKYAGKYQSEMYGEANLAVENGKLVLHFGPNFTGDLEHWNYDTFRVVWRDRTEGRAFVNFRLSTSAKVDWMNVNGLTEFTRVPDAPPASSSTGNQ